MDHSSKRLNQRQREELVGVQQNQQTTGAQEFASAEEMLRVDAAQTQVPPVIVQRLNESISREPRPVAPWWKRWLGGTT